MAINPKKSGRNLESHAHAPIPFSRRLNWGTGINPLARLLAAKKQSGTPILDLTVSNPTAVGLDAPPVDILNALAQPAALQYEPDPAGLITTRQAVCDYYRQTRGVEFDPGRIVLTCSTSEAYAHLFRLLANPGDQVLIPRPSYPLFTFLAALESVEPLPYDLLYDGAWAVDLESVRRVMTPRSRAVVIVSPNNPTGSYLKEKERQKLMELCRAHGLAIIVDEVFLDYRLSVARDAVSTAIGSDTALTFTLSGLSKITGLPQMKLAWVAVSGPGPERRDALRNLEVIADTFLSVSTPIQMATPTILEYRQAAQDLILARLRENLAQLNQDLDDAPVRVLRVEGGWSAVLKLPVIRTDEEWALELLRYQDVLFHPGHFFEFQEEGHLVCSLLTPPATLRDGIARMCLHLAES